MRRILKDTEIADLIAERKPLPASWRPRLRTRKARPGYRESELEVKGDSGHKFKIIIKENPNLPNDFSVILVFLDTETTAKWRLKRHNSPCSFPHTNWIEFRQGLPNSRFENVPHIHTCTERYQEQGSHEDLFAETTEDYTDLEGAITSLVKNCGFVSDGPVDEPQTKLF